MNKDVKNITQLTGRKTYLAAWVCEGALFFLNLSLAYYNINSGSGGPDITNAFFLGAGFIAMGFIELSKIPLASSIRVSRSLLDKTVAFVGILGLSCLSAFTVFEWTENASFTLCQRGRAAFTIVEQRLSEIDILKENNKNISLDNSTNRQKLQEINREKGSRLQELMDEHEKELEWHEKERRSATLDIQSKIDKIPNDIPLSPIHQTNNNEIERLNQEMNSKLSLIKKNEEEARENYWNSIAFEKANIEKQLIRIQERIDWLQKQRQLELANLKGVLFMEKKRQRIRSSYDEQIETANSQLSTITQNLSALKSESFNTLTFAQESKTIEGDYWARITALRNKNDEIRKTSLEISKSIATKREEEKQELENSLNNAISKYASIINSEKQRYFESRKTLITEYDKQIQDYKGVMNTDADVEALRSKNGERIKQLSTEIQQLKENVELELAPVLYWRLAKMLSDDKEELPGPEDYARMNMMIFLPLGIFFSLISATLAFIGTGLLGELPKSDRELKTTLKTKNKSLANLKKQNSKLRSKIDSVTARLINFKQTLPDIISQIPQQINIMDVELDEKTISPQSSCKTPWQKLSEVAFVVIGVCLAVALSVWIGALTTVLN